MDDTVNILKELFNAKSDLLEARVRHERELREAAIREQELARGLAKENVDARLHEMNALRTQINAERGSFMTKEAHERYDVVQCIKHDGLTQKIDDGIKGTSDRLLVLETRRVTMGEVVAVILALAAIAVAYFHK